MSQKIFLKEVYHRTYFSREFFSTKSDSRILSSETSSFLETLPIFVDSERILKSEQQNRAKNIFKEFAHNTA